MTEKRFISRSDYDWWFVKDTTGKFRGKYDDWMGEEEMVDCLNALHEENRELQRHLDVMRSGALTDDKRIKELYNENEQLKQRNDRQYNQLKQLWELIEDEDYNTLRSMLNQRETDEKLLQKEWGTYSD